MHDRHEPRWGIFARADVSIVLMRIRFAIRLSSSSDEQVANVIG